MVYGYLPDEQADVELAGVVGGGGGDGGAHGDAAVGLDEARAEEVVAPRRLVRVRLHTIEAIDQSDDDLVQERASKQASVVTVQ